MADYEGVETVEASADDLFAYLSDVGNLPDYMRRMTSAEPAGDGAVHTTAELDFGGGETRTVSGEAWIRVEAGVREVIENVIAELDLTLGLAGETSVDALRPDMLADA